MFSQRSAGMLSSAGHSVGHEKGAIAKEKYMSMNPNEHTSDALTIEYRHSALTNRRMIFNGSRQKNTLEPTSYAQLPSLRIQKNCRCK